MRDAGTRSCEIGGTDLEAVQTILTRASQTAGREVAVLMVNAGAHDGEDESITFGFVSSRSNEWFKAEAKGWDGLFPSFNPKQDHAARRDLAREIWHCLPDPVQALLDPRSPDHAQVWISGDERYSAFPWELLRFDDGAEDYLGLHQALPRIGSVLAPALERVLLKEQLGRGAKTAAIIAAQTTGDTPLEGVLREAQTLQRRLPDIGGAVPVYDTGEYAHDGLMRQALEARPDILYYTGRGAIIGNEEVLVLHTEKPRGPLPQDKITYFGRYQLDDLAMARGGSQLLDHAPLVVLNSCMTGRTKDHGGKREDMIDALLSHGAGAVLATALPIYDGVGEALGQALFSDETIARPTVGENIVAARRQLARGRCSDITSPFWGAWGMVHVHGRALATHPLHS